MTIRLLDTTTKTEGEEPTETYRGFDNEAMGGWDLDNDSQKGNEFDFDMSIKFTSEPDGSRGERIDYGKYRDKHPSIKAPQWVIDAKLFRFDNCTPRNMSPPTVEGARLLKNQPTRLYSRAVPMSTWRPEILMTATSRIASDRMRIAVIKRAKRAHQGFSPNRSFETVTGSTVRKATQSSETVTRHLIANFAAPHPIASLCTLKAWARAKSLRR